MIHKAEENIRYSQNQEDPVEGQGDETDKANENDETSKKQTYTGESATKPEKPPQKVEPFNEVATTQVKDLKPTENHDSKQ